MTTIMIPPMTGRLAERAIAWKSHRRAAGRCRARQRITDVITAALSCDEVMTASVSHRDIGGS